jgi:dihydroorotase
MVFGADSALASGLWPKPIARTQCVREEVPLTKVIEMSTRNPAQVIRRPELGHLNVGAGADVAVFNLRTGDFGFLDVRNVPVRGSNKLECELTLRNGRVAWDLSGRAGG